MYCVFAEDPGSTQAKPTSVIPRAPATASTQSSDHPNEVRGRQRRRNEENWKKTIRKRARNSGEAYRTVKGKGKAKKEFKNISCGCKKKCDQKFEEEERRRIFESFCKLADFRKQNVFIRGSVMSQNVSRKQKRDGTGHDKNVSYSYTLRDDKKNKLCVRNIFLILFYSAMVGFTDAFQDLRSTLF